MLLIAVRHGETEWNVEGREMGQLDSPLTTRGVRQAEALAQRLSLLNIDALYSSDLGRAVQTAEIIGSRCGKSPNVDARLRERHLGVLQGLTRAEIADRYPEARMAQQQTGSFDVIPEGETRQERADRGVTVLSEIAARHAGQTVAVVTHSGILTGFLEFVLGLPGGSSWRFRKDNASFNAFRYEGSIWTLNTWNDVSHLKD